VQLGLENKKKMIWLAVLGPLAILVFAYEVLPMFMGSSESSSNAQAAAPVVSPTRATSRPVGKGKKQHVESLDPTLRMDLLAQSEQTIYEGSGRNIFISAPDTVEIPSPKGTGVTDNKPPAYVTPTIQQAPPIPLKFFGFASKPGEAKKIFLQQDDNIFVAGEGEIVNRRYKVVKILPNSVEMQDVVNSGPTQTIPLTQG